MCDLAEEEWREYLRWQAAIPPIATPERLSAAARTRSEPPTRISPEIPVEA
jgi:hypothetical protein